MKPKSNRFIPGFTFVELLVSVGVIALIVTALLVALRPSLRFAEARDSRRAQDIDSISRALALYAVDNDGQTVPGVDGSYRMLGTATDGCSASCNYVTQAQPAALSVALENTVPSLAWFSNLNYPFQLFTATPAWAAEPEFDPASRLSASDGPVFELAQATPAKVVPGDTLTVTARLTDQVGVTDVRAAMAGLAELDLELISGSPTDGVWQAEWIVEGTVYQLYTTQLVAKNQAGQASTKLVYWRDPPASGWVNPTGFVDAGSQWVDEPQAYDENVGSYASNQYGGTGWGEFIEFTLPADITSDRVRVYLDYTDAEINQVDIDVFLDGAWYDVFLGGDEATWNGQYVEVTYPKGDVSRARIRYDYAVGGFFYWIYEFAFYQTVDVLTSPVCSFSTATTVRPNLAALQGSVDDDGGEPIEYRFQYGTTPAMDQSTTWISDGKVSGDFFSQAIDGLTEDTTYYFRGQIRNSVGTTNCPTQTFTTTIEEEGWVYPVEIDTAPGWENLINAYDDSLTTYARSYHDINDPQWSEYVVFDHPTILADRVRFKGLGGTLVSQADVDVFSEGEWQDVFQGSFTDQQLNEISFSERPVSQARVRFFAAAANTGFFWQLHDFGYFRLESDEVLVYDDACLDLTTVLEPYLKEIPYDPEFGSAERTFYLVKRNGDNISTVAACGTEVQSVQTVSQ